MYNLHSEGNLEFSGLSRNFLFRRLEPWTTYSLTLEACTSAGCTRTPPQHVTTAAAPPASQPPPRPVFIGPDHVALTWGPPSHPNGPIGEYCLLGRTFFEEVGRGRSNKKNTEKGKVGETKIIIIKKITLCKKIHFTGFWTYIELVNRKCVTTVQFINLKDLYLSQTGAVQRILPTTW